MATREERLMGYQLIKVTDNFNTLLLSTASILQVKDPSTGEPLKNVEYSEVDEKPSVKNYSLDEIKALASNYLYGTSNLLTLVEEFLIRYPYKDSINNALGDWNISKSQVDSDVTDVNVHGTNAEIAVSLQTGINDLKASGALLSLYAPAMNRHVVPDLVPAKERRINMFQDVINAACINLTGRNSDFGTVEYSTVEAIKYIVNKRISCANSLWNTSTPQNAETIQMKNALLHLENELPNCNDLESLTDLGVYVETLVPQLPLARRWWNF